MPYKQHHDNKNLPLSQWILAESTDEFSVLGFGYHSTPYITKPKTDFFR